MRLTRILERRTVAAVAVGLLMTLVACSSTTEEGSSSAGKATTDGSSSAGNARWRIAGVQANQQDPYFITMHCGARHAAKQYNVDLKWTGSTNSEIINQIRDLEAAALQKPDGIFQTPFDPTAMEAPVRKVMQQGIPYVISDGSLTNPVAYKWITTTHTGLDKTIGGPIAEAIGGSGKIGILAYAPNETIDVERYSWKDSASFKAAYPEIRLLPVQYTKADLTKSSTATQALIQANPDIKAIFATNGPELQGAVAAVKALRKVGKIKLFGYSAPVAQDLNNVRQGVVAGIFAFSPYATGEIAVKLLKEYLDSRGGANGPVTPNAQPYEVNVPFKLITASNIDDPATKPFYGLTDASGPTC